MKVIGTLSTAGWLKEPARRLVAIMDYYKATNPSQTLLYRGRVFSLQSAIQSIGGNDSGLEAKITADLNTILTNNFDGVDELSIKITYDEDEEVFKNIEILATIIEDGSKYSLATALINNKKE